ncbi:MAG: NAD-dependent epimerase/dehydratase family protein [Polyangiaceae bacterium]
MADVETVLVTGAFGYVGLAVVRAFAASGVRVVALGHAPRNEAARAVIPSGVEVIEADVLACAPILAKPHAAARCGDPPRGRWRSAEDRGRPWSPRSARTSAPRPSLRRRAAGVSRLYSTPSTIAVYGTHRDHGRPYVEIDSCMPDDPYGIVKEAAEHAWVALAGGVSLRLANIFGAGAGVDMGINGAVERFARAAASGGSITVFGTGAQRIDYVHVDDVARAFELAAFAASPPPVVNIGSGAPISIAEMAAVSERVGRELGTPPTRIEQPAPAGKSWPDRSLAIDLAKSALGWQPTRSFESGFAELARMMQTPAK